MLIAHLGVLGTSFAWFVQLLTARAASSTRVGLILSTEAVFATVFAVVAAGNRLDVVQILGGLLLVLSAAVGRGFEGHARAPGPPAGPALAQVQPGHQPQQRQHQQLLLIIRNDWKRGSLKPWRLEGGFRYRTNLGERPLAVNPEARRWAS